MKKLSLLALAMALLIPLTMVASADATGRMGGFQGEIDRVITQLDDGVMTSITTEDSGLVEQIQERAANKKTKNEDVTKEVEILPNGVRVTITSDDADQVKKIQERSEKQGRHRGVRGGCHGDEYDETEYSH